MECNAPSPPKPLICLFRKITRNLSLNKYKRFNAEKRGFGETPLALSELNDCILSSSDWEQATDDFSLVEALNGFLAEQPHKKRIIFVQRYWYLMSIRELAELHGNSESQTKSLLFRMRNELKTHLEKEGITI